MTRKTVYIYSVDNSARLQMAQGFAQNYLDIDQWTIRTGGSEKKHLHPLAIKVMDEKEIDIRNQISDFVDYSLLNHSDYIINLSGDIDSNFRNLASGVRVESWSFEDPERAKGTEEEKLIVFRRVRDAIDRRMREFVKVEG